VTEDRDPVERIDYEEDDIEPLETPAPDDIPTGEPA
jgi:hypothetical protein